MCYIEGHEMFIQGKLGSVQGGTEYVCLYQRNREILRSLHPHVLGCERVVIVSQFPTSETLFLLMKKYFVNEDFFIRSVKCACTLFFDSDSTDEGIKFSTKSWKPKVPLVLAKAISLTW